MNEDYREMLYLLLKNEVEFLVIGAYAMSVYGVPRATGDIDIWVNPTIDNSKKVFSTLIEFGSSLNEISEDSFSKKNIVFQIGLAPRRIDIVTSIDGVTFSEAFENKNIVEIVKLKIPLISRTHLIQNKTSSNRLKDKADLEVLLQQRK